jgi:hypothetical protein
VADVVDNKPPKKILITLEVPTEDIRNRFVGLARTRGTTATKLLQDWVMAYLDNPEAIQLVTPKDRGAGGDAEAQLSSNSTLQPGGNTIESLLLKIITVEEVAQLADLLENAGSEMKGGLAHSLRSALKYYKVIYVTRGKVDR